jgi:predicted ester cyclase
LSAESNKEIVRRFVLEAWNGDDLSVVDELVHRDYEVGGVGTGPEAVKRNIATYRTAFPDLRTTIEQLIAEGEWVAVRLTLYGTHPGPLGGIPPSGKPIAMNELVFWKVVDGELREIWSQGDALGLRIQIGAIPASAWHEPVQSTSEQS